MIRRREKAKGVDVVVDLRDVKAIMEQYEHRCVVTGKAAPEHKLTLIRVKEEEPMTIDNAVPVAVSYARTHPTLPSQYRSNIKTTK